MQGSYRDRLEPLLQRTAERTAFVVMRDALTSGQRNQLAHHYRYIAAGDPEWRGYIVDLIEGRELLDQHSQLGADTAHNPADDAPISRKPRSESGPVE